MLENPVRVVGGPTESVFQPGWSPDGVLHFVVESSGWWNLYSWADGMPKALYPMDAEFGRPQWVFGMSTYGFASPTRILCCYSQHGNWHLAWLDTKIGELTPIESGYTDISHIQIGKGFAAFLAGSPTQPPAVVRMDTESGAMQRIRPAFEVTVDTGYFSTPESITFPTDGGQQAHAIYYPPANKDFRAPVGERPPLIVISHGGPTGAASNVLRYATQFWTSRGFAVADVNYGGSAGYGREYRQRLNGNWGVVDLADCCNAALSLVDKGLADRNRLAIRGGSAGGYTTLACLTFRNDVFKAGASHFGLSELEMFAKDTHKFESRYMYSLIGPYPARRDLYFERSPINYVGNISAPIILFQGDEDKIVPPSQSKLMFEAVRSKGLPVAYLLFQGEQHGFRKSENIKRSLEAELYFYGKIFGFEPADPIEAVAIENL
jgi:dipeptidyl aminopeptidase/acylaminoacyl peptidase